MKIIDDVGCLIMAQTEDIVPADKILYASRDISATVDCMPLIAGKLSRLLFGIVSRVDTSML